MKMLPLFIAAIVGLSAFPALRADISVPPNYQQLKFEAKMVKGKKTWLPAVAKVRKNGGVEITLINSLPEPHGFYIKDFTEQIIVNPKETKTIAPFVPKTKGKYPIKCQLHEAHVGATLVVE